VRVSEQASAHDSKAYRRSVAAFAALGYAWVFGCLVVATGLVAWLVPQLLRGGLNCTDFRGRSFV